MKCPKVKFTNQGSNAYAYGSPRCPLCPILAHLADLLPRSLTRLGHLIGLTTFFCLVTACRMTQPDCCDGVLSQIEIGVRNATYIFPFFLSEGIPELKFNNHNFFKLNKKYLHLFIFSLMLRRIGSPSPAFFDYCSSNIFFGNFLRLNVVTAAFIESWPYNGANSQATIQPGRRRPVGGGVRCGPVS